jgi:hypothetical protein
MRKAIWRGLVSRAWLGLAFLATAAIGFAQSPENFDLYGIQGQQGLQGTVMAGVYTSPYLAYINDSTVGTNVICDDYSDDSYVPEDWDTYATQLSQLNSSSPVEFQPSLVNQSPCGTACQAYPSSIGYSLGEDTAYMTEAILAEELLAQPMGSVTAGELSFAMWDLFDPQAFTDLENEGAGTYNGASYTGSQLEGAANTYLQAAITLAKGDNLSEFSNVTIYTYDPAVAPSCSGSPCPSAPPQEFIAVSNMPEPSSVAILGADLLAVAGLVFFFRRRLVRS